MKIVVIGGSGLVGKKIVEILRAQGHDTVAASPNTGVNTLTGEGLAAALADTHTVVDVANSPSFEDRAVMEFFETSGHNLLTAEAVAGVAHHIALSVVGTERLQASGYFRAKLAQENLIKASKLPYTIVHSTQFFEFANAIAQTAFDGQTVRLSPSLVQPIAAEEVSGFLAEIALGPPMNRTVEIAGPERMGLDDFARTYLAAKRDMRKVTSDVRAPYYGTQLEEESLIPSKGTHLGQIRFKDWLGMQNPLR